LKLVGPGQDRGFGLKNFGDGHWFFAVSSEFKVVAGCNLNFPLSARVSVHYRITFHCSVYQHYHIVLANLGIFKVKWGENVKFTLPIS
jgi:hypothetical protein